MRVDVIAQNLEIRDAIRKHAEAKAGKLHRHFDGVQQITFRMTREDHQAHGEFGVELVIDVIKRPDFVAHAKNEDLYAAIDLVVQKGIRQLTDFKEQLKQGNR